MALQRNSYYFDRGLTDGDHEKELGIELYRDDEGYNGRKDVNTGEADDNDDGRTKILGVVTPFELGSDGKKFEQKTTR